MLPEERLNKILEHIKENKSAEVDELAKLFGASKSTIRRDLKKLDRKDIVQRTHGGAVLANVSTSYEKKAQEKRMINPNKKQHIGKIAAKYVYENESILLDSGSTTLQVAKNLYDISDLTVITYDLRIAIDTELSSNSSILLTGGVRRNGFEVLVGSETEKFISKLSVDKAFLGADAIDFKSGITNATFAEVSIKQEIIKSAKEVILVADHTKFNNIALVHVTSLDKIDKIITDKEISSDVLEKLEEKGLEVIY